MMPRALLFDVVETLIELREPVGDVYARFAASHGVSLPAWRLTDSFRRVLQRGDALDYQSFPLEDAPVQECEWWRQRVRSTFLAADSTVVFEDFAEFFDKVFAFYGTSEAWRLRDDVHATLQRVRDNGIPMGVVSNFDHRLLELLEGLEIAHFFDCIINPSACGSSKPDALIFQTALTRLEVSARDALYVGDDPQLDFAAAAAIGMPTFDVGELPRFGSLLERIDLTLDSTEPKAD